MRREAATRSARRAVRCGSPRSGRLRDGPEPTASGTQAAVCTAGQCISASARRCTSVSDETVTSSPDLENA